MVKNFLAALGLLFLLLVMAGGFLRARWKTLDRSSYEYAMDSVSFVFANWDFQELKTRADNRMFANASEEAMQNAFASMGRLGALESVEGCQGQSSVNLSNGLAITAQYVCEIKFEKDLVTVTLVLAGNPQAIAFGDANNSWKILMLNASSKYLAKSLK